MYAIRMVIFPIDHFYKAEYYGKQNQRDIVSRQTPQTRAHYD